MLLCGEIDSYPYKNKDYGPIFSVAEVPLNGIATVIRCCTLSFSERNVSPMCSLVLDVHVKQHEMHMSYCPTCTCRTALHVHLKQRYTRRLSYVTLQDRTLSIPEKETDSNDKHH